MTMNEKLFFSLQFSLQFVPWSLIYLAGIEIKVKLQSFIIASIMNDEQDAYYNEMQ